MTVSNQVYTNLMAENIELRSGLEADDWALCSEKYGNYLTCPTAHYSIYPRLQGEQNDGEEVIEFNVVAHNPSTVTQNIQRFKVKPSKYIVTVFDETNSAWWYAESNVECYDY